MKIIWHYWCGAKTPQKGIMYVKYLLISANSLIKTGNILPSDIYVTIEKDLLETDYGKAIKNFGVNILHTPEYKNYSKQICYTRLLDEYTDIDKLVQIDCDTLVTDPGIRDKISRLEGCINIDCAGGMSVYDLIVHRDGQRHEANNLFSLSPYKGEAKNTGDPSRFASFKDLVKMQYDIDLEQMLEESKNCGAPTGYIYVLSPKLLPEKFFEFMSFFNFFFEDDEVVITFAKIYFQIEFDNMKILAGDGKKTEGFRFSAKETSDFEKYKGVIHFPGKDKELDEYMTEWADRILEQKRGKKK